ncbi:PLD nuclease N-terminal domain-containing protein [Kocuria sp. TGY1127_2]|uniref:PLD nuclease N-terminal domain-containing protein n=1 Tax=Kocuria sp. TGY1127_2 TaxID=2711328 RepID=UPI0015BB3DDF|nr:PLD nuclease N-terminal domain-containing protein [Kocuria sp. TGY1127_2]
MRAVLIIVAAAVVVGMTIYALLDISRTEKHHIVALPKPVWFVIALVFPVLGPVLWLIFGYKRRPPTRGEGPAPSGPRPGAAPDDDEAYLRFLDQQTERRKRDEDRRRREQGREQDGNEGAS